MTYVTTIGPIDAQETKQAYFVFSDEVASGATISSASVVVSLVTGSDADPDAMKVGAAVIDNATKVVAQSLRPAGRTGNRYKARCVATDSNGLVHVVAAEFAVVTL